MATPAQRTSLRSMTGAPRKSDRSQLAAVAIARPQPADAAITPAAAVGYWRHGGPQGLAPDLPFIGDLIAAVNHLIDGDVMQEMTDEGCRHGLKASAWRVIKSLNQGTRSRAFAAAVARK